jgi:hypothetical protein
VDFFTAVRLIVRRWYVVTSAFILTMAVAYTIFQTVAPTYEAEGSVLLFAPAAPAAPAVEVTATEAPVNPFRSFDGSTALLASVIVQIMDDTDVRDAVEEQGGRGDYVVGRQTDGTPVIVTRATDLDAERAMLTVRLAMAALQEQLDRRQADAGAPPEVRIRAIVLTEPTDAAALVGARVRAALAVMALGVAASVSLAFIVESVSQSRRRAGEAALDFPTTEGDATGRSDHGLGLVNGDELEVPPNGTGRRAEPAAALENDPADARRGLKPSMPQER